METWELYCGGTFEGELEHFVARYDCKMPELDEMIDDKNGLHKVYCRLTELIPGEHDRMDMPRKVWASKLD